MLGGLLALLAAATFGFNNAAIRRGVLTGSVLQALVITVPMGVPMLIIVMILTGQIHNLGGFPLSSYFWLGFAGILHFVWGRYCNYRSTRAIGGNLSGPWQQANMILSLTLAIILLDETLTPLKVAGIGLIIFGVVATNRAAQIAKRKAQADEKAAAQARSEQDTQSTAVANNPAAESAVTEVKANGPPVFKPNYAEGYTFALLSATGYGVSPIIVRMGLEDLGPSYSVVGAFISYFSAAVVVGLIILFARQWPHVRAMSFTSVKWFSLAGLLVGISQTLRYVALSIAPVTVVAPIQATSNIFRVIFAWLINKEHEVFGGWIFVGMFLTFFGVAALTVSTEMVLAYIPLPEFLQTMAGWEWP
jgi:drug/metabolite transporter (DMT)-like permease